MSKKKIIIIVALFLILVILAAGAFFFLKARTAAPENVEKKKVEKPYSYLYSPGAAFVTNVLNSDCLVKLSIIIEINKEKQEEFLSGQSAIIRDLILNVIREHSEKEIRDPDIQQNLSDTLCKRLNEKYEVDFFVRAYFTDIVIQ